MSGNIDEKVVVAKFDNAKFEANVKTTLQSLEILKKGMNLKDATRNLADLDAAGKRFSLAGIASGVDKIAAKFDWLHVVATAALSNITIRAVELGKRLGQQMFGAMTEGFGEYEKKMQTIQTMLVNTGSSMKLVNKTLGQMAAYANKTVYSFGDMANNMGLFTAAGVKLKPAMKAIMGIGNLAAMSGSSAQQASTAMYQLSQAMASGVVKLQDWISVSNAGMGGKVFQNALIRTAKAHGANVDAMIKKNGSFKESLKEGWLTSKVLTDTLTQMTGTLSKKQLIAQGFTAKQADDIVKMGKDASDAAKKVKTFSQLMETLNSNNATGWADTWQIIIGDLKEARKLFGLLNDQIGGMMSAGAKERNDQLKLWKKLGGRKAIFKGIENAFAALTKLMKPVTDAFAEVFPPSLGKNLYALSIAFRDFTASLLISDDQASTIHDTMLGVFTIFKMGGEILSGAFRVIGTSFGGLWEVLGVLGSFLGSVLKFFSTISGGAKTASDASDGISKFFYAITQMQTGILEPILTTLKGLVAQFDAFLNQGDLAAQFVEKMAPILAFFDQLKTNAIASITSGLAGVPGAVANAWQTLVDIVKNVFDFVTNFGQALHDAFAGIGPAIDSGMKGINLSMILNLINTGLFAALTVGVIKFAKGFSGFFSGISDAITGLTSTLKQMQDTLKAQAIMMIAGAILMLAAGVLVLSKVNPERLLASTAAIGALAVELLASMALFQRLAGDKGVKEMPFIAASLLILSGALLNLAKAVKIMGEMDPEQMGWGIAAVTVMLALLVGTAQTLSTMDKSFVKTAAALVIFAGALVLMTGVVVAFSLIPLDMLAKGLGGLAVMLVMMVGAAVLMSKFAPDMWKAALGMMAMAAAINMLVGVIAILGLIPIPVLVQGFLSVLAIMALLVGAAILTSKFAPQMVLSAVGMMAMAAAVMILAQAVILLGLIPIEVLVKGFVSVIALMALLVGAAMLMTTALPGAVAMLAVAGAMLILTFAVMLLAAIPFERVVSALFAIFGAIMLFGLAAAVLTPVLPVMLGIAGAIALMGVAALAFGLGMVLLAVGAALLGPALQLLFMGLKPIGENLGIMGQAMLAFVGLGIALSAFSLGAALAGGGLIILGIGLISTAAGLLALAFASTMGITGLASFVLGVQQVAPMIGTFIELGGALIVLGAGLILTGVGMLLVGAGAIVLAVGLVLLNTAAAGGVESIGLIVKAFTALWTEIPAMLAVGAALLVLGAGAVAVGIGVGLLGSGVMLLGIGMLALSGAAYIGAVAVQMIVDTFAKLGVITDKSAPVIDALGILSGKFVDLSGSINGANGPLTTLDTKMTNILSSVERAGASVDVASGLFKNFAKNVNTSMESATDGAVKATTNFAKTLNTKVKTLAPGLKASATSVGKAIDSGLIKGMDDGIPSVTAKAREVARKALTAAKDELDSNSPSKETAKLGRWFDAGLVQGMHKHIGLVENEARGVAGGAMSALKKALDGASDVGLSGNLVPTIQPVLDLSAVRKAASQIPGVLGGVNLPVEAAYAMASSIVADQRAAQEQAVSETGDTSAPTYVDVKLEQNNYSPKALSEVEIYRQTKNQVSLLKGVIGANKN